MGRKSKANSRDNTKASKKVKVSAPEEEIDEEEEEDVGPWDGIRAIVEHIICRSDGCDQRATATWVSQKTGDQWDMCDECQMRDFGECYTDSATPEHTGQDQAQTILHDSSPTQPCDTQGAPSENSDTNTEKKADDPDLSTKCEEVQPTVTDNSCQSETPSLSSSETMEVEDDIAGNDSTSGPAVTQTQEETPSLPEDEAPDEAPDGQYDLKKIFSLQDLQKEDTICCSRDDCGLPAFGLYVNSIDPKDRWYYCLDCQEGDFDGWPPVEDLPIKYMEPEHLKIMALKCSSRKNPPMPVFPTPSPERNQDTIANFVTPSSPKDNSALVHTKEIGPSKVTGKAKAIEVHKKWLEAAQAMGGSEARIVVSKPAAKKLIFDFLYDSFQPMNITQIYKGLLAVVPQPVLNICLQEMVPDKFDSKNMFQDSDEEESDPHSPPDVQTEPYSASLVFKVGKNLSTNLYFVDYTKVKQLDRDEREGLMTELANARAELEAIQANLKSIREVTATLLAQPTNEVMTMKLEAEAKHLRELEEKVQDARKLKVNEKHREKTKRRIENMASHWRQRRRSCLEFLTNMEEITDGAVSRSKCLKGDGQIAIDSDEAVAKAALEYAKEKRTRSAKGGMQRRKTLSAVRGVESGEKLVSSVGLESDIVAVTLDAQLNIVRVYGSGA